MLWNLNDFGLIVELFHFINFINQVGNCQIYTHLRVLQRLVQSLRPVRLFVLSQKQVSVAKRTQPLYASNYAFQKVYFHFGISHCLKKHTQQVVVFFENALNDALRTGKN